MRNPEPIDLNLLKKSLLGVENPARYAGSEYHFNRKRPAEGDIGVCMCFGDLYEIGMANNAVKIIFDILNSMDGVFCDRGFSVAPDFEEVLRDKGIPLFSIAENIPLKHFDLIGISVGSELGATNILQIIDLSHIAIDKSQRTGDDPIIIAGGPAATNPHPFAPFFDFVYIGEAENGFDKIIEILKRCADRRERIEQLKKLPFLWYSGRESKAIRAIDLHFADDDRCFNHFVVPSFQVSQDNGYVEIMRGCPNGCRFCHAGQYYKPYRQRSLSTVHDLVKQEVKDFGYREITLASLSSGDYPDLDVLIALLNNEFAPDKVSFSLPSLKVNTFALDILQQISEVRKSGLTFAIETPLVKWQHAMNKEVPVEQVISIIQEAKQRGWRLAKFYFMVGLPFINPSEEEAAIVDYLSKIHQATRINMSINIGTFIPKAHTPFQWVAQMSMEDSQTHLKSIKNHLKEAIKGIKVSYHEPFVSFLEGVISRGDEDTALLIRRAYEKGARLDAWDEYLRPEIWNEAMDELSGQGYDFTEFVFSEHSPDERLPWDDVSMGVSKSFLAKEHDNAGKAILTARCLPKCSHKCGVCSSKCVVREPAPITDELRNSILNKKINEQNRESDVRQVILVYSKSGKAAYLSHINVMRAFEQTFQRAALPICFTQGFNPKPRTEFLNPLTLGMKGDNELAMVEMDVAGLSSAETPADIPAEIMDRFNAKACEGIKVHECVMSSPIGINDKKLSLASRMEGSVYLISCIQDESIRKVLEEFPKDDSQIAIRKAGCSDFAIRVAGEKNIMKAVFPAMNKFEVIGACEITRLAVNIAGLKHETPYD